jgi:hypothetical protein
MQMTALGVPRRFGWAGRLHRVCKVLGRWRVDEEWWAARIWREYFRLYTDTGMLVEVYHDFLAGDWYIQRLYD